eukprot:COSAG05_NODE_2456_length_3039_cov_2.421088_4_plen_87_part_00
MPLCVRACGTSVRSAATLRRKQREESALRACAGLRYTILRPGCFIAPGQQAKGVRAVLLQGVEELRYSTCKEGGSGYLYLPTFLHS